MRAAVASSSGDEAVSGASPGRVDGKCGRASKSALRARSLSLCSRSLTAWHSRRDEDWAETAVAAG